MTVARLAKLMEHGTTSYVIVTQIARACQDIFSFRPMVEGLLEGPRVAISCYQDWSGAKPETDFHAEQPYYDW